MTEKSSSWDINTESHAMYFHKLKSIRLNNYWQTFIHVNFTYPALQHNFFLKILWFDQQHFDSLHKNNLSYTLKFIDIWT